MVQTSSFYYKSKNGENDIYAVKWENTSVKPKAILQIAHGIAEYIMRYDDFARFIAEKGLVVVGNDHAGHGKSVINEESKGFFAENDGWNCVVSDIKTLRDTTKQEYPELPYICMGHSMGSFLMRTYAIDYPEDMDALIISGTGNHLAALCDTGIALMSLAESKNGKRSKTRAVDRLLFGSYNYRIKNRRTKYDWISRDEAIVDKYAADSDCGFIPSNGLISDMLGGIKYITNKKNTEKMKKDMPVYFFSGEEDPVGEYGKGVHRACMLFLESGMRDVAIKIYEGGRHEMLNETNREEVYSNTIKWIESKLPRLGK